MGGGASEGNQVLRVGPRWDRSSDLRRADTGGHSTGPGRVGSQRAGGSLRAGQRGLPRPRKAVALTQADRPAEPQRADVSQPPGLGCFVTVARVDCCGRTWGRQFTCNQNVVQKIYLSSQEHLTAFLSVPTMMAKFSEKQNRLGSQCVKISQLYNSRDFFREGKILIF